MARVSIPKREPPSLEWVRPPQQVRSRQTLERLLDAAEALIVEQGVEATSMSQVARRARSSVGALYARFADKDALVCSVFERFIQQSQATMDSVFVPGRWERVSLRDVLQQSIRFLLRVTRERHRLVTSLMTYAVHEANGAHWLDAVAAHLSRRLYELLDARGELPKRADPAETVAVLAGLMLAVAESRLLRPPDVAPPLGDSLLVRELTQMAVVYLGVPPVKLQGG